MAWPPTTWSDYISNEIGDRATWWNMPQWYFGNMPNFGNYCMVSYATDIDRNTFIAIKLLIDKCNELQAQIDTMSNGITWQSICEAWLANDFEGRGATIAIIDRMRQILWDEPFSIVWAARPERQKF